MMQLGSGTTREWNRVRILFIFSQYTFLFICCIFLSLCVNQLVPFHGIKLATEELPGYLHSTSLGTKEVAKTLTLTFKISGKGFSGPVWIRFKLPI